MSKLIVLVFAIICCVNAKSSANSKAEENDRSNNAFAYAGFPANWNMQLPAFPQMPQIRLPQMPKIVFPVIPTIKPLTPEDIAKIKPAPGSHVFGSSQTMTSHTEYVNGKPVTKTQGTILKNEDGKVYETTYESP